MSEIQCGIHRSHNPVVALTCLGAIIGYHQQQPRIWPQRMNEALGYTPDLTARNCWSR